jgi:hypothetical protein
MTGFLVKATGPSKLRSELRLKTKPLNRLLKAFKVIRTLQTQVPREVMGGDVLALMSEHLRQILSYSEPLEKVMAVTGKSRFTPQNKVPLDLEREGFSLSKGDAGVTPAGSAKKPFYLPDLEKTVFQNQDLVSSTSLLSPRYIKKELKDVISKERNQSGQPVTSLFVEKLREYRQLSQKSRILEGNLSHPTQVEKDRRGNGFLSPALLNSFVEPRSRPEILKPLEEEEKRNRTSFSTLSNRTLTPRPWPEMTGQEIAEKLHAFVSGQRGFNSSEHIRQTIPVNSPEKVEIQNIFHIEVKAAGDRDPGSLQDLSEKITDILRQQALQHGIDIT